MINVNDIQDHGYIFLTCYFDRTKHNKYTTTMLRRRITASYADCKTTSRANLVHRIQDRFPDATFEDQEYFHIHQPFVERAVAQSVRYWFEDIPEFNDILNMLDKFYRENLIEGSDLIKLRRDYEVMYGTDNSKSESGYVILSHHTDRMNKSDLEELIEDAGFIDRSLHYNLEPREYGFLRYPDVTNPTGFVLKYWYENMSEEDVREALIGIVSEIRPQTEDTGKIIFTEGIQGR